MVVAPGLQIEFSLEGMHHLQLSMIGRFIRKYSKSGNISYYISPIIFIHYIFEQSKMLDEILMPELVQQKYKIGL